MNESKKIFSMLLIVSCVIATLPGVIAAKSGADDYTLPEQDGTYDVPGKPGLKLRVIVHHAKGEAKSAKPAPVATEECGIADPESANIVSAAGWHLPASWTFRVNSSSVPAGIRSNVGTIISNSYAAWAAALDDKVVFSRNPIDTTVSTAKLDRQNIVTWGRTSGTALAVTYIWYDDAGLATEIDTVMNNKFKWSWSDPSSPAWSANPTCAYRGVYDAQDILTHELGHTVGLDDEMTSDYADSTMYGYGSTGETKKDTLTTGDIAGASAIYG